MIRVYSHLATLVILAAVSSGVQAEEQAPLPVAPPHRILLQLEERGPEAMTAKDRNLIAGQQEHLTSAIAAYGYNLAEGSWSREQAVCPLLPEAILLRYGSDPGTPHATRFVAVVPRDSGDVRVIPVLRSGNTPFSAGYKNSSTISLFNRLLSQAGVSIHDPSMDQEDRWVKLALCYAELSGDHPTTLLTDTIYGEAFDRNVNVPMRRFQPNGSVVFEFSDVNDPRATVQWDLAFDAHGQLVKVTRAPRPLNTPIRRLQTQTKLNPVPKPR